MRAVQFLWVLILIALSGNVLSQRSIDIPEDLAQWRDWVLHDQGAYQCPLTSEDRQCLWPGTLTLAIDASGAIFTQSVSVIATSTTLGLPGSLKVWPQDVRVNGQAFPVTESNGTPSVTLPPGEHRISGALLWQQRPARLQIPATTGLIDLSIDGAPVARADRTANSIWLARRNRAESNAQDNIETVVHRLVRDDMPTRLLTHIELDVSGSVRETELGAVLPDGYIPITLSSVLPVRFEADGTLKVQVRPGTWQINLDARAAGTQNAVTLGDNGANMPDTEIWSYASNDRLRVSTPSGVTPVDPAQTDVPEPWENLPAFRIQVGETLAIDERSRGKTAGDNRLTLRRSLWRDFNGGGFTFVDAVSGTMVRDWRLDMKAPFTLQGAQSFGDNLLVTRVGDTAATGVELRTPNVEVAASGRVDNQMTLPVSGWQSRFDDVRMSINLPTGSRLLAVAGADTARGTWVAQWQLLDFFLVLLTTVAAARVFGRAIGALALVTLLITIHEAGAPAFIWLNLLIAAALVKVAPKGRLLQLVSTYQRLSIVALALLVIPFVLIQMRAAIYPDLDPLGFRFGAVPQARVQQSAPPRDVESDAVAERAALNYVEPAVESLGSITVTGARLKSFKRYASDALVPVGPGTPEWSQVTYNLAWPSPVSAEQTMRLIIMPRWLVSVWRVLMVVLVGALTAVFILDALKRLAPPKWLKPDGAATAATLAVALVTLGTLVPPAAMADDYPSPALLDALRARLTAPEDCEPNCISMTRADVRLDTSTLRIRMQVDALTDIAARLPGAIEGWRPSNISVDGVRSRRAYRDDSGAINVLIEAGTHTIVAEGPLPTATSFTVPFPLAPRLIQVDATDDWFVAGLNQQQLVGGALQLTRQQTGDDDSERWSPSRFPAFVRVERRISLSLDWSIDTVVTRLSPANGAFTVDIPLLDGEQVTSESIPINDATQTATVGFGDAGTTVRWRSKLPRTSPVLLTAGQSSDYYETWTLQIGSSWRVEFDGVPESLATTGDASYRAAVFFPRPGETLTVDAQRPSAAAGETLVFDDVSITTDIGQRLRKSVLTINYRATRGAQHSIALPASATVTQVLVDGARTPLRLEDSALSVPILPGEHSIEVSWQEDADIALLSTSPAFDLGIAASNIRTRVELPRDRWIVVVSGDGQGPVILYWSALVALLLIAAILSRLPLTPLNLIQWLLLGLGFSVFSWPTFFLIAVWLLLLGSKRHWQPAGNDTLYNLVQFALGGLSIVTLMTTVGTLSNGLLGGPEMGITGNGSYASSLLWFQDLTDGAMPAASAVSLPSWCFKALILIWALWLSLALLRWLPWAWQRLNDGGLWRSKTPTPAE
ncbi:MAG: hypothetical protein AAF004_02180 [Pseudomonadota bacterium]